MKFSRRDVSLLLPALLATRGQAAEPAMLPSKSWRYEDLVAKPSGAKGINKSRAMFDGATHGGLPMNMHETELAPGEAPHPPHHHSHEEMILVWQGTVEVTISGKVSTLGPGSAAYVASGEEHGWRNSGTTQAQYFVIAFGQAKAA